METSAAARVEIERRLDKLDVQVKLQMKSHDVPGVAIASLHAGKLIWTRGYGATTSYGGMPIDDSTVFEMASNGKVIGAYLALTLADRGELNLDEPIHNFLPSAWVPSGANYALQTTRQLLTHTSGLGNSVMPVDKGLKSIPGEQFQYSGVGYMYLQHILEQQTGKSLENLAQEEIFRKLNMENSSFTEAGDNSSFGHTKALPLLLSSAFLCLVIFSLFFFLHSLFVKKRGAAGRRISADKRINPVFRCAVFAVFCNALILILIPALVMPSMIFSGFVTSVVTGILMMASVFAGIAINQGTQRTRAKKALLTFFVVAFCYGGPIALSSFIKLPMTITKGPANLAYSFKSTAKDYALFLENIFAMMEANAKLFHLMTAPTVKIDVNNDWSSGFAVQKSKKRTYLWHWGSNPGQKSLVVLDLNHKEGIVILTNSDQGLDMARTIAKDFFQEDDTGVFDLRH